MKIYISIFAVLYTFSHSLAQNFPDNPANTCVLRSYASTDELIYFDSSGLIILEYQGVNLSKFGYWEFYNDTIYMAFNQDEGHRGIGKPKEIVLKDGEGNQVASPNFPDEYDSYVFFIEKIDERDKISFNTIKKGLIDNSDNAGVLSVTYPCSTDKKPGKLPGKYPFCSTRLISESDLMNKTKRELRIMRNEIFARYGYEFKSRELMEYFSVYSWYEPNYKNVDHLLSEIELKNIDLISQFE